MKITNLKFNKLIAEFMGVRVESTTFYGVKVLMKKDYVGVKTIQHDSVRYDSDWKQLMPVVDKIEELGYCLCCEKVGSTNTAKYISYFRTDVAHIRALHSRKYKDDPACVAQTRLEATYLAVIEFILYARANQRTPQKVLKSAKLSL